MDVTLLSRLQFATTTVFHFFFVPLTLGLVWYVVILETVYVLRGDPAYKRLAQFWGKLFLINFAVGVVTGIVLEFEFGMNWSVYARYVGDIFGTPLAIEALLTFFLESTFLGVWIFGWNRVPRGVHAAAIWLIAIGSSLSAFWILTANGFMHHPVGYVLAGGRAEMADFAAIVFNPRAWYIFWHTMSAGLVTGSFFILGVSAWHLARRRDVEAFRLSFGLAAVVALLSVGMVILAGDQQSKYVREVQPMAAAASEGLMNTADPAPFSVVAGFDSTGKQVVWDVQIPAGLSFLYFLSPSGTVEGINQIQSRYAAAYGPGDYVPLVALDYWMFRLMVALGFLMLGLGALAIWMYWRRKPEKGSRLFAWLPWVIPLPYLANSAGWILTENGRQPWIVQGLLKTSDAVSPNLAAGTVLVSLIGFGLLYLTLAILDFTLMARTAAAGFSPEAAGERLPAPPVADSPAGRKP